MTSLRESPIRRQPPNRPGWLIPVLAVVGVLVVVGLIYAVVAMARGGGSSSDAASPEPSACVTTTVVPGQSLPKPAKVVVNVYNASGVSGLAGRTADEIGARGFRIGQVDNDPTGRTVTGVGEIRYGPKGLKKAQLLAYYVPGATLVALDRKGTKVDLAMGKGFNGLAAQDEVDAALTQPSPVASGPGCSTP
jgi:hypothetical protein